nr:unnamed protein product [Fasciola hepatica]
MDRAHTGTRTKFGVNECQSNTQTTRLSDIGLNALFNRYTTSYGTIPKLASAFAFALNGNNQILAHRSNPMFHHFSIYGPNLNTELTTENDGSTVQLFDPLSESRALHMDRAHTGTRTKVGVNECQSNTQTTRLSDIGLNALFNRYTTSYGTIPKLASAFAFALNGNNQILAHRSNPMFHHFSIYGPNLNTELTTENDGSTVQLFDPLSESRALHMDRAHTGTRTKVGVNECQSNTQTTRLSDIGLNALFNRYTTSYGTIPKLASAFAFALNGNNQILAHRSNPMFHHFSIYGPNLNTELTTENDGSTVQLFDPLSESRALHMDRAHTGTRTKVGVNECQSNTQTTRLSDIGLNALFNRYTTSYGTIPKLASAFAFALNGNNQILAHRSNPMFHHFSIYGPNLNTELTTENDGSTVQLFDPLSESRALHMDRAHTGTRTKFGVNECQSNTQTTRLSDIGLNALFNRYTTSYGTIPKLASAFAFALNGNNQILAHRSNPMFHHFSIYGPNLNTELTTENDGSTVQLFDPLSESRALHMDRAHTGTRTKVGVNECQSNTQTTRLSDIGLNALFNRYTTSYGTIPKLASAFAFALNGNNQILAHRSNPMFHHFSIYGPNLNTELTTENDGSTVQLFDPLSESRALHMDRAHTGTRTKFGVNECQSNTQTTRLSDIGLNALFNRYTTSYGTIPKLASAFAFALNGNNQILAHRSNPMFHHFSIYGPNLNTELTTENDGSTVQLFDPLSESRALHMDRAHTGTRTKVGVNECQSNTQTTRLSDIGLNALFNRYTTSYGTIPKLASAFAFALNGNNQILAHRYNPMFHHFSIYGPNLNTELTTENDGSTVQLFDPLSESRALHMDRAHTGTRTKVGVNECQSNTQTTRLSDIGLNALFNRYTTSYGTIPKLASAFAFALNGNNQILAHRSNPMFHHFSIYGPNLNTELTTENDGSTVQLFDPLSESRALHMDRAHTGTRTKVGVNECQSNTQTTRLSDIGLNALFNRYTTSYGTIPKLASAFAFALNGNNQILAHRSNPMFHHFSIYGPNLNTELTTENDGSTVQLFDPLSESRALHMDRAHTGTRTKVGVNECQSNTQTTRLSDIGLNALFNRYTTSYGTIPKLASAFAFALNGNNQILAHRSNPMFHHFSIYGPILNTELTTENDGSTVQLFDPLSESRALHMDRAHTGTRTKVGVNECQSNTQTTRLSDIGLNALFNRYTTSYGTIPKLASAFAFALNGNNQILAHRSNPMFHHFSIYGPILNTELTTENDGSTVQLFDPLSESRALHMDRAHTGTRTKVGVNECQSNTQTTRLSDIGLNALFNRYTTSYGTIPKLASAFAFALNGNNQILAHRSNPMFHHFSIYGPM